MLKFFILLVMIFLHIIDDYNLQGWLANAKQRSWWKANAPDRMYRYDYLMALLMHSFSWAFLVMLPVAIHASQKQQLVVLFFFMNLVVHAIVDHMKANMKIINLVQDQLIHILQILVTWTVLILI